MLFKAAPKRGGVGLMGILVIVGVLYFTGAGGWMWQRIERFGNDCYGMVSELGVGSAAPVCNGVTQMIAALDRFGATIRTQIDGATRSYGLGSVTGGSQSLQALGAALQERVSVLGSGSQEIAQMMGEGPQKLLRGNAAQQLRSAVDSFTIGQHYLQDGSASQALPWLRNGASLPSGYGLMSQLSLGDMYSRGAAGVAPDAGKAQFYYAQAQQSLATLSNNPTPQGQQLLQSLPASPQAIQQQLTQAIAGLTKGVTH